jgi:hypothetical protein
MPKSWAAQKTKLTREQATEIARTLDMLDDPETSRMYTGGGSGPFFMRILPEQVEALQKKELWDVLTNSDMYSFNEKGGGHQVESRRLNIIANGQDNALGV